jgi:hypothetical protein
LENSQPSINNVTPRNFAISYKSDILSVFDSVVNLRKFNDDFEHHSIAVSKKAYVKILVKNTCIIKLIMLMFKKMIFTFVNQPRLTGFNLTYLYLVLNNFPPINFSDLCRVVKVVESTHLALPAGDFESLPS